MKMTKLLCGLSALAAVLLHVPAAAQEPLPAYKFILDYDVPESPAFVALGVSPEKVTTGSASKPIVVNLLNQIVTGDRANAGLALDLSPYFVFGGRFRNINEYREDRLKRLLANTLLSLATIQDPADSANLRYGIGARLTLFDDHDPLQNGDLTQRIEQLLTPAALPAGRERSTGVDSVAGLALAYSALLDTIRSRPGRALSVGWGMAGTVRGAVLEADSITGTRHRFWAGYRETFRGGVEFLGAVQMGDGVSDDRSFRIGGALRANVESVRLTGEVVYESETGEIHPGGIAVIKLVPQVDVVASLGSEPDATGASDAGRLRFRTMLRWNFSQGGNR
jgi:hypothetical protein